MRTISGAFCAVAFLFLGVQQGKADASICGGIAGNLVTNCGFETGDFTGWTLSGNDVPFDLGNLYGVEGQDPFDGISPNSGNFQAYFADLVDNTTTLSQTIATSPGANYTVSLYLAQDTALGGLCNDVLCANELDVTFDGITLDNLTDIPVEGYTEYAGSVTVTDSSSVLNITVGNDLGESLLDDVSVVSPEPSAWKLALGGMILVGITFRRKLVKKNAAL